MAGNTADTDRKVERRLVAMTWSKSAGVIACRRAEGKMPALAHRMSMAP